MEYFYPGQKIRLLGIHRRIEPSREGIALKFPSRIHVAPIDLNRLNFSKPGGGGIGFAVGLENSVQIALADEDNFVGAEKWALEMAHIVSVMKKVFGYDRGFRIHMKISEHVKEHKGFGSTVMIITSCAQAINMLFADCLPTETLRRLVGYNFVEHCKTRLARGCETGVGTYVVLKGGIAVIADDLRPIYHSAFLPTYHVALINPCSNRPSHDEPENLELHIKVKKEDIFSRYQKAYVALMDLIPALARNDAKRIGDIFWRFQFTGTNLLMIQNYSDGGSEIYQIMAELRNSGVNIVGLSSLGPTIYAISKDVDLLTENCRRIGVDFLLTRIDNAGMLEIGFR